DPAANIARIAEQRGVPTLARFFSPDVAHEIVREEGHASVITATNVFAHVDDLDAFVQGIDHLLKDGGVLVIEAPYLSNLLRDLDATEDSSEGHDTSQLLSLWTRDF